MTNRVLQLDVTGRPLGLVSPARSLNMLYQENANLIEYGDGSWRSSGNPYTGQEPYEVPTPLIIQTKDYVKLRPLRDDYIISRVLLARDNWECQYCEKHVDGKTFTIDHVKPRDAFVKDFVAQGYPTKLTPKQEKTGVKTARELGHAAAHTWDNVVVACQKCNHKKANKLPYECGMYPRNTPRKPSYVQTIFAGKKFHPAQAQYVADYYGVDVTEILNDPTLVGKDNYEIQ